MNGSVNNTPQELQELIGKIEEIVKYRKEQKRNCINDYNLLSAVLNVNDEVRLHSGMIYSLFDPDGSHYRGTQFLKLFLEEIDLRRFDFDPSSATVEKESEFIDLYLYDTKGNHIIIENKINAGDQENQIKNYIEKIKKTDDNVLVIYLSLDRKMPTSYSLGGLELNNDSLQDENGHMAYYKSIHYKDEILSWLGRCLDSVDSCSLSYSLHQYINVVRELTGKPNSKLKQFDDIFKEFNYMEAFQEYKDNKYFKENEYFDEIAKAYKRVVKSKIYSFLDSFCSELFRRDPILVLGDFDMFIGEAYFVLNYKDLDFVIYLKPNRSIGNDNFFDLKSIALRPTKDWSLQGKGSQKLVLDRNNIFKQYLKSKCLETYIIGDINHKGEKIEELKKPISFKEIFNHLEENFKQYDFEDIKNHIGYIKLKLKI